MTTPSLIRRLRTAAEKGRGIVVDHGELARVYLATRSEFDATDERVEAMRLKVVARLGMRLTAEDVARALPILDGRAND